VGFTCSICGQEHEEEVRDVRARYPEAYFELPPEERDERTRDGGDFFLVELVEGDRHFIRALIEVPIAGSDDHFRWGIWVELSEEDIRDAWEHYEDDELGWERARSYPGRLASKLPEYGTTLGATGVVRLREGTLVPAFELDRSAAALSVDQREGITVERARELAEPYRHSGQ
jgi:hypothetical protein